MIYLVQKVWNWRKCLELSKERFHVCALGDNPRFSLTAGGASQLKQIHEQVKQAAMLYCTTLRSLWPLKPPREALQVLTVLSRAWDYPSVSL